MVKRVLKQIISTLIPAILVYACANMGMPKGGPKDKTPPVIVKSIPEFNQVNFKDSKVRITFNEFVIANELSDKFIVSPPTTKRPKFTSKGKTFIVDLNEKLHPNTTYSLDFKDGVVDNNENNSYRNLRMAFSTGPVLDTLRIVGFVRDAFTLEPSKNCYILLYKGDSDTLIYKTRPDFIAKTNFQGFFVVSNLPVADYQIFALSDVDNNLKYTAGVDSIAFLESRISPTAKYEPQRDTVVTGADTLVVQGKTRFFPDPLNFSLFFEKGFDLSLDKYNRTSRHTIDLTFTASTADTFNIDLLNVHPEGKWNIIEKSKKADTLKIWLTDSLVYKRDTLSIKLSYLQQDSLGVFFTQNDTIKLFLADDQANKSEKNKRRERRKIETEPRSVVLSSNVGAVLDPYRNILLESPEPILTFDTTKVKLFAKKDTIFYRISPKIYPDSANLRRIQIAYPWGFGTTYRLSIDSTALHTVFGLYSKVFKTDFKTQEEEHYGKIIFSIKNVTGPTLVQILENSADEKVVKTIKITKEEEITFPFLEPNKYVMKAIFDRNNNGIWDTGKLKEKIEPEETCYYLNVIKVKSNWDSKDIWILPDPLSYKKKIIDVEAEAEKLNKKKKKNGSKQTSLF